MLSFKERVWRKCREIPPGKITTYALLAQALGNKNKARAVGNALKKNPFWPQVPCHRVIKSEGGLGGFLQGKRRKARLLAGEGLKIEKDKVKGFRKHLYLFKKL